MTAAKDQAKKIYLKFIELLKEESITDRNAFKDVLNDFAQDLRKMSDYIKNNEGKKIMEGKATSEKEEIENNLMQAIVKEKPNVKWEDVAGLSKAK